MYIVCAQIKKEAALPTGLLPFSFFLSIRASRTVVLEEVGRESSVKII